MEKAHMTSACCIAVASFLLSRLWFDRRNRDRMPFIVNRNEGEIRRVCVRTFSRKEVFLGHPYADFHGRMECTVHRSFQDDNFADPDGMMKVQFIDGRCDADPVRMAGCRDCRNDIDHMHQPPPEQVAETIGIIGEYHFGHFHQGVFAAPGMKILCVHVIGPLCWRFVPGLGRAFVAPAFLHRSSS